MEGFGIEKLNRGAKGLDKRGFVQELELDQQGNFKSFRYKPKPKPSLIKRISKIFKR